MTAASKTAKPATSSLRIYFRLLGYLRPFLGMFAVSLLGYMIFASSQPMMAGILKYFVDELSEPGSASRQTTALTADLDLIYGIPLLLVLVAMTVVVLIRVVGIILVLALLTAPAAAAAQVTANLKNRMAFAALFGMVSCFAGLAVSYRLNIASGAVIVMVSAALYLLVTLGSAAVRAFGRGKSAGAAGTAENGGAP